MGKIYDRSRRLRALEKEITEKPSVTEYFIVVRHRMNASVYLLPLLVYSIATRIIIFPRAL